MRIVLEVQDDQVASLLTRLLDEKAPHLNPLVIPEGGGFLNVQEAAKFLKYSVSTIYRHVEMKSIPFHRKARKIYFLKEELHNWMTNKS